MAQEEKLLSKQPMYPSDSEQLVFLMNNLDKDFISRAERYYNKPLKAPISMVAQVGKFSPYITIHPRVTLFWGVAPLTSYTAAPLTPYTRSNTMIGLFLPQEAHRPRDLKNWPKILQEAKALSRPRYGRRASEPTPLADNVHLVIACYGARAVDNLFAP